MLATKQIPPCPHCGGRAYVSAKDQDAPPEPGDWLICVNCGTACHLDENMQPHPATENEWQEVDEKTRNEISHVKAALPLVRRFNTLMRASEHGGILRPENHGDLMDHTDAVYAFILKDGGKEATPAFLNNENGMVVPLIATNPANLPSLKEQAQAMANRLNRSLTLCKFSSREEVEVIQPNVDLNVN